MTKMIKISLVAAVAVAGLTTVNAQPLEEAIKGVDVSGMVRYRFEQKARSYNLNDYRIEANVKSKVNDAVTANVGLLTHARTDNSNSSVNAVEQDANPTLTVRHANFAVNLAGAAVTAGKQALGTPFTDGTDQQGTGILAVVPAGPVTLAAGYFMNNSISAGSDALDTLVLADYTEDVANISNAQIATVAVLGKVADVSFDAWYLTVGKDSTSTALVAGGVDAYTVGVKVPVGPIAIDARHTVLESSTTTKETENSLTKLVASAKVGSANVVAGYVMTGTDGGLVALDNDAATGFKVFQLSANNLKDAKAYHVAADMDVISNVNVKVSYTDAEYKSGTVDATASELLAAVTYKMSKNFTVTGIMSDYTTETATTSSNDDDDMRGRLELKYTF